MADIFVDGNTSLGVYEHSNRYIEIDGIPYGGWTEITGGGTAREGRKHIIGAGGKIRGMTNGIRKPQPMTIKFEPATWEALKEQLTLKALALGNTESDGYECIDFNVVDQYKGANILQPSITVTTPCRVNSAKPATPNDGSNFEIEVELMPSDNGTVKKGL